MAIFNRGERTVLCVILIVTGLLLAFVSGGFMVLANGLDGLHGMGNPSAEMQERARQASNYRDLLLIALIVCGGILTVLDVMILPPAKDDNNPQRNPMKDAK